jgi:hypothetical protein
MMILLCFEKIYPSSCVPSAESLAAVGLAGF